MASPQREQWQLRVPLPVLRRSDGVLQLGLEPPAGLLLGVLPPTAERVLDALAEPRTLDRLGELAGTASAAWLPHVLGTLRQTGLLVRRPASPAAAVTVVGCGQLTVRLTRLLLDSVPGPVQVVWPGATMLPATLTRLRQRHPSRLRIGVQFGAGQHPGPGLVVACAQAPEVDRALLRQLAGRAHLSVHACDLGVGVGPLVVPGRTPCLHCEDLHRTQRDPAWPGLLLQLSRPRRADAAAPDLQWAAGLAVRQVASWLAGGLPDALGATLTLDTEGSLRVRRLRGHPGCGCGAVP